MNPDYIVPSGKPLQLSEVIDGWCIYFAYGGSLAVARAVNPLQEYQYAVFDRSTLKEKFYHVTMYHSRKTAEKSVFDSVADTDK